MADQIKWIVPDDLRCPHCNYVYSGGHAPMDGVSTPDKGDITICINCATPATYMEVSPGTLGIRDLNHDEWPNVIADEEIGRARALIVFKRATEWGSWPGT